MLQKSSTDCCAVCLSCVSINFIFCVSCSRWVHMRIGGISGSLMPDPPCGCNRCTTLARAVDGKPISEVTVGWDKLGWCHPSATLGLLILRWRLWTHFHHRMLCLMGQIQWAPAHPLLLPISHYPRGTVYNTCVRSAMLLQTKPGPQPHLQRNINIMMMIWW